MATEHQLSKRHLDGEAAVLEMAHRHGFFQEGWVRVFVINKCDHLVREDPDTPKLLSENKTAASATKELNLST